MLPKCVREKRPRQRCRSRNPGIPLFLCFGTQRILPAPGLQACECVERLGSVVLSLPARLLTFCTRRVTRSQHKSFIFDVGK